MGGTTLMKVEENNFDDSSITGYASASSSTSTSSVSKPPEISLQQHQSEGVSLKIETTVTFEKIVEIKSEEFREIQQPLLNQEKSTNEQGPREYRCQVCISNGKKLKTYASKACLNLHMVKVHRPTPRLKCQVCFKDFQDTWHLNRHSRQHLNQASSFSCEICFVTFSSNFNLNVHLIRKHNYSTEALNVKEYPCDLCTNIYYCKTILESHVVQMHVVDKPLECHVCSKSCIDQKSLSKHLKGHDRQSCHICNVCSRAFKQKKSLLRHLGIEHHHFLH